MKKIQEEEKSFSFNLQEISELQRSKQYLDKFAFLNILYNENNRFKSFARKRSISNFSTESQLYMALNLSVTSFIVRKKKHDNFGE